MHSSIMRTGDTATLDHHAYLRHSVTRPSCIPETQRHSTSMNTGYTITFYTLATHGHYTDVYVCDILWRVCVLFSIVGTMVCV